MKRIFGSSKRTGFTIIELIVVIAILATLAMIVLPKLDGLQSNANHAVGAVSASDTGRYIQIYKATKLRYPDGWDSLMSGAALWAPSDPSTTPVTRGLHRQLSGATNPKLQAISLSANDVTALNNAGIFMLYSVDTAAAASVRPGDQFNIGAKLAAGTMVASVINTKIIDHIYRDNTAAGGTSGALPTGAKLIAFGFGPHNDLIGTSVQEVPSYPNVDATLTYNRNLVIFEINGTKCTMKAVVGADGDLIDDMAASINKDS